LIVAPRELIVAPRELIVAPQKNHCVGCGKQDHSVFFSGNIQDLKNSDIDEWIRSYSPNMTHIVREENTGYGLVHFKSCSEAGLFFREMYDTRFTGPFNTTIKFSAAKKFRSNEFVQYAEDVIEDVVSSGVPLVAVTEDNENSENNENMESSWKPTTDFYVTKESFIINMELPGLKKEDINVNLCNNQLVISGDMKRAQLSGGSYKINERHVGPFTRKITLTSSISDDNITATFENGLLKLNLFKSLPATKKIDII
ncbi:7071_t:CDS:2, partial [Funneliformis caledonium]